MQVVINGVSYDIGYLLDYAQTNADGAYQDKLKYRLVQQNNLILALLPAIARDLSEIREVINDLASIYIWASDDNTILASDDDTILTFYTYSTDLQDRVSVLEDNVQQLAGQHVIAYAEDS